jgi:hypothetical protein
MWQHEEVAAIAHIIDDTEVSEMALVTTIAQREDDDGGSSPHRIESEDVHTQYRKRMNQWTPKPSAECIDGIACLASAIQIVEGHTRAMGGMSEFVGAYLHYRVPGPEAPLWPRVEDEYNETWHELWQSPEPSDPQEIESEDEYEPEGE